MVKPASLIVAAILFSILPTWAIEPDPFELHAVVPTAGEHTKAYTMTVPGNGSPEKLSLDNSVLLDHHALLHASVSHEQGELMILVRLTAKGTERFGEVSTRYLDKRVAFVLDGQLCCAPVIKSPMFNGSLLISGNFREDEAKALVEKLNRSVAP